MNNLQKKEAPSIADQFKVVAKQTFTKKDGKLNPISVGLAALIIALLIGLTGTVVYKTSPKSMQEDIVNGLSSEDAQKAVQNAFLAGLDSYLNGEMTEEETYNKLMQLFADYLNSDTALTDAQKVELETLFNDYLHSFNLDEIVNNSSILNDFFNSVESYEKKNEQYISNLKDEIYNQITNNQTLTEEELAKLNDLYTKIEQLEKKDVNQLTNIINDNRSFLEQTIKKNITDINSYTFGLDDKALQEWLSSKKYTKGDYVTYNNKFYMNRTGNNTSVTPDQDIENWEEVTIADIIAQTKVTLDDYQKRIQKLEDKTTTKDKTQDFQFDFNEGSYGYWIGESFYPF